MIGKRLGRFEILELIGSGGMGHVYLARDESLQRNVAIKILPSELLAEPEARESLRREALALSRLNHPNIATIHELGSDDGLDFLVMEYIEGETLAERLSRSSMEEEEILQIGAQLSAAMGYAHELGLVHRDLKPANVKITPRGHLKVLDFGIATMIRDAADADAVVEDSGGGTVPYMAPERLVGDPSGPEADVWSLGVVLYEACTGRLPFEGDSVDQLSAKILRESVPPLPEQLSGGLRGVIHRCLRKEPSRRYRDARSLSVALETLHTGGTARFARRRRPTLGAAVVTVGILVALLLGVEALRRRSGGGVADVASVVALPSQLLLGADDDEFLVDALPRTITTELSQIDGLITLAPPTSLEYEPLKEDMERLAQVYRVDAFVESSIEAEGDQLHLQVWVVDAEDRRLIWSGEYQGIRNDFLGLAHRASDGISAALGATLAQEEDTGQEASLVRLELEKGLHHLNLFVNQGRGEDLDVAADAFQRAFALDSTSSDAAAGIASAELQEMVRGGDPAVVMENTDTWARRAIRLDPQSSHAWLLLSTLEGIRPGGDPDTSLEYALKATTFGPRDAYAHVALANSLLRTSATLALACLEEAVRLNPIDLAALAGSSGLHSELGEVAEGLSGLDRALRIEPDQPYAWLQKVAVLTLHDSVDTAEEMVPRLEGYAREGRLLPGYYNLFSRLVSFAQAKAASDEARAQELLGPLRAEASGDGPFYTFWDRATMAIPPLLAQYGESEAALDIFETRLERGIAVPLDVLLWHPSLDPVRADPRYPAVLSGAEAGFQGTVRILREAEGRGELPAFLKHALADLQARIDAELAR